MSVLQRDGSFVITVEHVSDLFKEEKGKRKSIGFRFFVHLSLGPGPGDRFGSFSERIIGKTFVFSIFFCIFVAVNDGNEIL